MKKEKIKINRLKCFKNFLQAGQASRVLLVLAIVVLVAGIITYLILKMAEKPPAPVIEEEKVPQPVYETTINEIKFIFMGAIDRGNILKASQAINTQTYSTVKDLKTTERFIMVTVGAQNKGKINKDMNSWNIGDIVDAEGRHFEALKDYDVKPWLPANNYCGELLKPEFDPLPCTKIYEVSKASTGLKIMVLTAKKGKGSSVNLMNLEDNEYGYLDLIIK